MRRRSGPFRGVGLLLPRGVGVGSCLRCLGGERGNKRAVPRRFRFRFRFRGTRTTVEAVFDMPIEDERSCAVPLLT